MMDPTSHMTPLGLLEGVFPSLPRVVLYAALEACNGSLEGAVHLLLESGAQLSDNDPSQGDTAEGGGGGGGEEIDASLSAMQQRLQQDGGGAGPEVAAAAAAADQPPEDEHVLAITVPQGSRPNALLKITTTVGTVHARVPPGVLPGQSFFIRMRRGNPFGAPAE